MSLSSLLFAVFLTTGYGVPFDLGLEVHSAALVEGVDPYDLAAVLVSEHRGNYPDDKVASSGVVGVWQVAPKLWPYAWAKHHGVKLVGTGSEALKTRGLRSKIAAFVVRYSIDKHRDCPDSCPHWVAHWKCGPGGRDTCGDPVDKWLSIRESMP